MKLIPLYRVFLLILCLCLLAGCQASTRQTSAPQPLTQAETDPDLVIEGQVVPKTVYTLAFSASGRVVEVLVQEGELVEAGQALFRLEGEAIVQSAILAAELELLSARQSLQILQENHPATQNQALQAMIAARQAVQDAERALESLTGDALENAIAGAESQLVIAKDRLENAQADYEEYEAEPETDLTRASYRLSRSEAQSAYDEAARLLDDLQGAGYTFILQQAQDNLQVSQAQLELAEQQYEQLSEGPDADAVQAAEARIAAAEASLEASRTSLDYYELLAPASGSLASMSLKVGDWVAVGQAVALLVDFSVWYIETVDLTEMDVTAVSPGQTAQVVADALPEVTMTGTVVQVKDTFQAVRGDISYTARLRLENPDPRLKWGMTVLVTFTRP